MKEKGGKYKSYLKGVNDLLSPIDVKKIIVVDIGSNYVRVGLSGENFPLLNLQFLVSKSKNINSNDLTQTKLPDLFGSKGINVLTEKPSDYVAYYPLMAESLKSYQEEFAQPISRLSDGQQMAMSRQTRTIAERETDTAKERDPDTVDNDSLIEEELEGKRATLASPEQLVAKKTIVADPKTSPAPSAKSKRFEPITYSTDNWSDVESYMKYVFEDVLQLETTNLEIMFVDSIAQPKEFRQRLSELFFENLRIQSINFLNTAVCGLLATGRSEGVAVEVGHSSTNVVPIFGGIMLNHALHVSNYGGREATKILKSYLSSKGADFLSRNCDFMSVIEMIKEKLSCCSLDYETDVAREERLGVEESCIELPDGSIIEIDRETKYATGEVLLRPTRGFWNTLPAIRDDEMDLVDKVYHSISCCEIDMQRRFAKNIVICGGASKTNGFVRRFKSDFEANLPSALQPLEFNIGVETNVPYSGWIGGSILGSIATFQNLKIKKAEWDEAGDLKSQMLMKRLIA